MREEFKEYYNGFKQGIWCKGEYCHNPDIWSTDGKKEVYVSELFLDISLMVV